MDQPVAPPDTRPKDVFISFSSADVDFASGVEQAIRGAGFNPYFYPNRHDAIVTGFTSAIVEALSTSKVLIWIASRVSLDSVWVRNELTSASNRNLKIIPLVVGMTKIPEDFDYLIGDSPWILVENGDFDDHHLIARIHQEILEYHERRKPKTYTDQNQQEVPHEYIGKDGNIAAPYVGPQPFSASMQDVFCGRDRELAELLKLFDDTRILVLHAASGAGKSSLLGAGFAPILRSRYVQVFPREGAQSTLRVSGPVNADIRNVKGNFFIRNLINSLAENRQVDEGTKLAPFLASLRRPPSAKRVLIIDQFEEIFFSQYNERFKDRAKFFMELEDALRADPTLRVVLSLRKEYLADVERLLKKTTLRFLSAKYLLDPIDVEGAASAICKPVEKYLRFEEDALTELLRQLRTIQGKDESGNVTFHEGEHIELAHLQVVCLRLWQSLTHGTKTVTMNDLQAAAGEGRSLERFVVNELLRFFRSAVERVSENHSFSKESIYIGCLKFISPQGTRMLVQREKTHTGRLPNAIVDSLVGQYVLREESRGVESWYELSHDLLCEVVSQDRDQKTTALLSAMDFLESELRQARRTRTDVLGHAPERAHGSPIVLAGYFELHTELLKRCQVLATYEGHFEVEEVELLFRSSIATGVDMNLWYERLEKGFPALREAVLREAISTPDNPHVRANAASVIFAAGLQDLLEAATDLAVQDPEPSVRRAAAMGLSEIDKPNLYARVGQFLDDKVWGKNAFRALAIVRRRSAGSNAAPNFPQYFTPLGRWKKVNIRARSWLLRAREAWLLLIVVFVLAGAFAIPFSAIYKAQMSYLGWGWSQGAGAGNLAGTLVGVFQSVVACVVWGGSISVAIMAYHSIFGNVKRDGSLFRPFGAIIFGAAGGLLSSFVVATTVIGVFQINTLHDIGWVNLNKTKADAFHEAFAVTKLAWSYVITGIGLGIGYALMANSIRIDRGWIALMNADTTTTLGGAGLWHAAKQIFFLVLPRYWLLLCSLAAAAEIAYCIPNWEWKPGATYSKLDNVNFLEGLVADCGAQAIGSFFVMIGLLLAVVIIRRGIAIPPARNDALPL